MTTLSPEQEKAREYLRRKGALLTPKAIHERVQAAFAAFEECVAEVSQGEARIRPAEGAWSVQEVVDHLVATHRPSLEEFRCLLRGERPPGPPIPASLQSPAPLERSWPEVMGDLRRLHAEIIETLARIPEDFTSEARAPVVMVINRKDPDGGESPLHWVEELEWKAYAIVFRLHTIDHLNQAKRVLADGRGTR